MGKEEKNGGQEQDFSKSFEASELLTRSEWWDISADESKYRCDIKHKLRKLEIPILNNLKTPVLERLLKEGEPK
jgi:hypothetical protein